MKKKYIKTLALGMALTCAMPAMAQIGKTYQGTVLDTNGEPIIGATVRVPGTRLATVTDMDGHYLLVGPEGKNVVVSYIGYRDVTTTGGTVKLESANSDLKEVVVVGYGTQKKAHLTGSIATVDMEDIQDLSSGGLASTLSGLVNGLSVSGGNARPGESATLYIRDTNDLSDVGSTAQQPLFVIDGYIYPNDVKAGNSQHNLGAEAFNNLDPSEVESISVLKDAAAAVYGARAANGVILVKTKRGKMGEPRISYTGTFGFTNATSTPKMLSAYNYGRLYNAVVAADPTNTSLNNRTDLFQADELEAMKSLNYDLLDKYWSTGFTQQHSINVSGATEKVGYFGGLSYFDQDGNLGKLDYNRWNFRAGVDVKLSKWLTANVGVSGNYGKKNKPNVKVGGSNSENDYRRLLMRPNYIPESVGDYDILAEGANSSNASISQYNYNVLQNHGDYSKTMNSNTNINAGIDYDFGWSNALKGLKLSFKYSKSISTDKNNEYGSAYTLYEMLTRTGSGNHLYTPVGDDYSTYLAESNFVANTLANGDDTGYLTRNMLRSDNYQVNLNATYQRKFGLHDLSLLLGFERSESESEYLYGYVSGPYSFTTGQSNSASAETKNTVWTRAISKDKSWIGRFNYNYAEKYLFEFLLRRDYEAAKFTGKYRWGTFPSASAGWVISQERWFKRNIDWIDFLKIRGSYGLTGRDNTAAYQWMQVYAQDANKGIVLGTGTNTDSGNRITINKTNSAVNKDIHWDKAYKMNAGIDGHFLDQKLVASFDYFYIWNREMLLNFNSSIPTTVGTQSADQNVGELDQWGYEVSLTWKDKINKDFKYSINLMTGYSDNSVGNIEWQTEYWYRQIHKGGRSDNGTWGMQCIGMFRSFQDIEEYFDKYNITSYMGLTKDKVRPGMLIYKDVRGAQYTAEDGSIQYEAPDGIVDKDNDQVRLSNRSNPYGFTLNLKGEWKGLSLQAQFRASWGGYSFLSGMAINPEYGIASTNMPSFWNVDNMYSYADVYDASGNLVVAQNLDAKYPNLKYTDVNAVTSSFWRVSGTRVTLPRLTLAYRLPSSFNKALGIVSARINITGQNLVNFYNPYPDSFVSPLSGGYGSYPTLRKWTVGVNLTL